ncbi:hypothetical protein N7540_011204 [Penicillium herquei]|nr:hypothetical protein N7540_013231 [Penicillium herquei]KAJ6004716.1 hypothetical protein N7540_013085 [Penicillium herquei]KAJ6016613.1 hypothetical protein N7540_011204 [Penicillium herquei]
MEPKFSEGNLLSYCQSIFQSSGPDFAPQQAFIAIKKSVVNGLKDETQFLLRVMQQSLCSSGYYDSDEGCHIRLAIAFVRRCRFTVPEADVLNEGGKLIDLYLMDAGNWGVQIKLDSGEIIGIQGSLAELAEDIRYKV